MLPPFLPNGNLPPGIHSVTWKEFCQCFGRSQRRKKLLEGLEEAIQSLSKAGCSAIYIDGSFVTNKTNPGYFDACWDIHVDYDKLDPVFLDFSSARAAQKARFGGELFPAQIPEGASGKMWLDFFQTDRTGASKGIVKIDL